MTSVEPYQIIYATRNIRAHLRFIDRKHHSLIRQSIETMLSFEPTLETRNRKPLRDPLIFDATWEIRCGPNNRFRIFYEVDTNERTVYILAIGRKQSNRLFIGKEEIK